jgi:hypothetical protein
MGCFPGAYGDIIPLGIPPMTTYHIAAEPQTNPGKRVLFQFVKTVFFFLLLDGFSRVANGRWIYPTVLAIVGIVFFLGNLLTTFLWPRKTPSYDVEIDDNGIQLLWNGKAARTVRRDRVRYVGEWGSGTYRKLVVSEHGPVFTRWLWGGVPVPAGLPDYEQIKAEVLTWLGSPKT